MSTAITGGPPTGGPASPRRTTLTGLLRHLSDVALPRAADYRGARASWRADLTAGLTVGVVALPLALGFGVSSGLGAAAGLITAVVAGVVAAVFGGSHVQVSGPTGAMTVVLVPIVAHYGPGAVAVIGLLAGVLVMTAGLARLGQLVAYLPWPVLEGFTLGIAAIIFLQQIPLVSPVDHSGESTIAAAVAAITHASWSTVWPSLIVVAVVVVIMVFLPRWVREVPASLVAVVVSSVLVAVTSLAVPTIGPLPEGLPLPSLPAVSLAALPSLLGPALAVAALCAIESLLSARVADRLAAAPPARRTEPDRELFGQGLACVASAMVGGMPATGAIARTAVNVRTGGRTRVAAIVHSLVLLAVVLFGAALVAGIPLAALAAVLMVTAVRMVESRVVRSVIHAGRAEWAIFAVTAVVTVLVDLITAIEVGIVLAGLLALRAVARNSRLTPGSVGTGVNPPPGVEVHRVDGSLFFAAAPTLFSTFALAPSTSVLVLRLSSVHALDISGAAQLAERIDQWTADRVTVLLKGTRPDHTAILEAAGLPERLRCSLPADDADHVADHSFAELDSAVRHAARHVQRC